MKTEIFQYNNNPITFQLKGNGGVMISASQMAKPFGKLPADWLRTKQTKEFLDAKATMENHIVTDLVVVINGGDDRGTFMHEDVALEFARWLSPQFAIWCNAKIKELLRTADHCNPQDVLKWDTPTNGGIQPMTYVNESGLYTLIMGSKLSQAQRLKHWGASEVLPVIRKDRITLDLSDTATSLGTMELAWVKTTERKFPLSEYKNANTKGWNTKYRIVE